MPGRPTRQASRCYDPVAVTPAFCSVLKMIEAGSNEVFEALPLWNNENNWLRLWPEAVDDVLPVLDDEVADEAVEDDELSEAPDDTCEPW